MKRQWSISTTAVRCGGISVRVHVFAEEQFNELLSLLVQHNHADCSGIKGELQFSSLVLVQGQGLRDLGFIEIDEQGLRLAKLTNLP